MTEVRRTNILFADQVEMTQLWDHGSLEFDAGEKSLRCEEEKRHWAELIEWMKKIGCPVELLQERAKCHMQENENITYKATFLTTQRKIFTKRMEHMWKVWEQLCRES
jgi:hypothetical protein